MEKVKLAILASGSGTNAENLGMYFSNHEKISVTKILSNKSDAFVLERAKNLRIPADSFSKAEFLDPEFIDLLDGADYLILAGFLWLIPGFLIEAYPNRIINIHPSLLPKYGGKGMYGEKVHQAVIDAEEKESGITIHLVNEEYDKGEILHQANCVVEKDDTPDTLASRIHKLEYEYFPKVVEEYVLR